MTIPHLPARYDHVGSFLRPQYLLEAREKKARGEIDAAALRAVEDRAIAEVVKVAGNTSLSLYDRNRAVYELLRYGVKVKADVGAQTETVWLIDWKNPEKTAEAFRGAWCSVGDMARRDACAMSWSSPILPTLK